MKKLIFLTLFFVLLFCINAYSQDIKVTISEDLDKTKQLLNYSDVHEAYNKLPEMLKENIKEVELLDYPSKSDTNLVRIIATYRDGKVKVYQNVGYTRVQTVQEEFQKVFLHEAAHGLDEKLKLSNKVDWGMAIHNDFTKMNRLHVSHLKSNWNLEEDFAESVQKYYNNMYFKIDFPNRYKYIKSILN